MNGGTGTYGDFSFGDQFLISAIRILLLVDTRPYGWPQVSFAIRGSLWQSRRNRDVRPSILIRSALENAELFRVTNSLEPELQKYREKPLQVIRSVTNL